MDMTFDNEVIEWRGPPPYYFIAVPDQESEDIREHSAMLTYGWGVIPVTVCIGETTWTTSLFPKNDRYLVPVKDAVRRAEGLDEGDVATVRLRTGR